MTTELLEERLRKLAAEAPDAGRASARALAASPRRARPVWPRVSLGLVAAVVAIALVAYFVPAADTAIASRAPWGNDVLQWAGLVGARDRITYVNAEAVSSGYRLQLVGIYADSTRTVLLLHATPNAAFPTEASLTDQFGRSYQTSGGTADLRTGDASMQFEALAWPDQFTGARITFQVATIDTFNSDWSPGPHVQGSWRLSATVGVDQTKMLPPPADATLGPAHFHFTSLTYSAASIAVEMDVTGASPEDLSRNIPDGRGKAFPALTVDFIDPSGAIINGSGGQSSSGLGPLHVEALAFRASGGGDYVLRVGYYPYGSFDRVMKIP